MVDNNDTTSTAADNRRETPMIERLLRLPRAVSDQFQWGCHWVLLQIRMRLHYWAVVICLCAILVPWLGTTVWLAPVVIGETVSVPVLNQVFVGVVFDPVILFGGLGLLAAYWRVGQTEYQLRHQLYDDIMLVPLTDAEDRHNDPPGSKRAVQLEMDRSVLVLGETGSGKTEAIRVLAHQLQAEPDEAFVVFDYKQDYQRFFAEENIIKLSSRGSTVTWNVFREIEKDEDCGEIAKAIFAGAETDNDYFTNTATQVLADVLRLFWHDPDGPPPTNEDLVTFLQDADVDLLRNAFETEDLSGKKHLPEGVEASSNIVSILEERVKAVFRGDFAEAGTFSVREYMADPRGAILVLDFPIQQSSSVQPIFRLLIDWSRRKTV